MADNIYTTEFGEDYHQDYVKKNGTNSCHIGRNPYLT